MSTALNDIWDEPVIDDEQLPPSASRNSPAPHHADDDSGDEMFRPSKRRRSSLFLDDPDEVDDDVVMQPNGSTEPSAATNSGTEGVGCVDPDIDALFNEVDDEMDGASSKPFDIEAYRREAQKKAEREVASQMPSSSYQQHAVRSSSPPPAGANGNKDDEDDENAGKKRKPVPKIDAPRLLGQDGFPALIRQAKSFKPKGKGHEQADLEKLINLYQFWAHKMMSKWKFTDTVNRVEKVCRTKRMMSSLSGWKDEFHGTIHGKPIGEDGDDSQSENEEEKDNEEADAARASSPSQSRAASSEPSDPSGHSHAPSRPPSSPSSRGSSLFLEDDDDLFDFKGVNGGDDSSKSSSSSKAPTQDVDESDMWAELEAEPSAFAGPPITNERTSGIKFKQPQTTTEEDDEDEMWAILREVEREKAQARPPPAPASLRSEESMVASTSVPEKTQESNDDNVPHQTTAPFATDNDWDDMYV